MNIQGFLDSLLIMGLGMAGIFIVIGIIALAVAVLSKLFPYKK